MTLTTKRLMLAGAVLIVVIGIVLWLMPDIVPKQIAVSLVIVGLVILIILSVINIRPAEGRSEPNDIGQLDDARRKELMRGTSLFLRESQYRYSIRMDASGASSRPMFNAVVNTIRLALLPAMITDISSDRHGHGYVAFVHDGNRWRGPGLPCPPEKEEALRHAARCVSPLAKEEETKFDDIPES